MHLEEEKKKNNKKKKEISRDWEKRSVEWRFAAELPPKSERETSGLVIHTYSTPQGVHTHLFSPLSDGSRPIGSQ